MREAQNEQKAVRDRLDVFLDASGQVTGPLDARVRPYGTLLCTLASFHLAESA